jgi:hypothetical protein
MSPIAYRDSAQELAQASQNNAAALQNAFKFGTQVYDTIKNRQIGEALKKGDTDKAALLESKKINNADPTSFWKWKTDAARTAAQQEADAQKMKGNLLNETAALMSNVVTNNPEAQAQYINNLNTQKAKLQNAGMDTSVIDQKIAEVTGQMQGNQASIAERTKHEAFVKNSAGHLANVKELDPDGIDEYLTNNQGQMTDTDIQKAITIMNSKRRQAEKEAQQDWQTQHNLARQLKKEREEDQKPQFKF